MLSRMIHAQATTKSDQFEPILPHWILDGSAADTLENAGFASGSALALLHTVLHDPHINVSASHRGG